MVQKALIEYIRSLQRQNYPDSQINAALLNAGYSQFEIEEAFRVSSKKFSAASLTVVFVVLIIFAIGVTVVLLFVGEKEVTLSSSMQVFNSEVQKGEDVVVTLQIVNPSMIETSGLIDFAVSGPQGRIAMKTANFKVISKTSIPVSIPIAKTAPTGNYNIRAVISYGRKTASSEVSFNVIESQSSQTIQSQESRMESHEELQNTCPIGCDDANFCTTDSCVRGSCVHETISPCCGNRICENGETSCSIDCSLQKTTPDSIRELAKARAQTDVAGAMSLCASSGQQTYIDLCLIDVAESSKNKVACSQIIDNEAKDSCLISFAYQNDFSVCYEIKSQYLRNACFSLEQVQGSQNS